MKEPATPPDASHVFAIIRAALATFLMHLRAEAPFAGLSVAAFFAHCVRAVVSLRDSAPLEGIPEPDRTSIENAAMRAKESTHASFMLDRANKPGGTTAEDYHASKAASERAYRDAIAAGVAAYRAAQPAPYTAEQAAMLTAQSEQADRDTRERPQKACDFDAANGLAHDERHGAGERGKLVSTLAMTDDDERADYEGMQEARAACVPDHAADMRRTFSAQPAPSEPDCCRPNTNATTPARFHTADCPHGREYSRKEARARLHALYLDPDEITAILANPREPLSGQGTTAQASEAVRLAYVRHLDRQAQASADAVEHALRPAPEGVADYPEVSKADIAIRDAADREKVDLTRVRYQPRLHVGVDPSKGSDRTVALRVALASTPPASMPYRPTDEQRQHPLCYALAMQGVTEREAIEALYRTNRSHDKTIATLQQHLQDFRDAAHDLLLDADDYITGHYSVQARLIEALRKVADR